MQIRQVIFLIPNLFINKSEPRLEKDVLHKIRISLLTYHMLVFDLK